MQALVLTAVGRVELCDRPEPEPADGEVILAVDACGICGSDVHGFRGEEPRRQPGLVLGHECVGRVVAPGTPGLPAGTRVAVNPLAVCGVCPACRAGRPNHCPHKRLLGMDDVPGAFAERTLLPRRNLFPLADSAPDEAACLIEPLACAVHLFTLVPPLPLGSLALFGGGTLGSLILVVAKRLGYGPITVIEPSAGRRDIALALGADAAVDPADGAVSRLAADGGVELSIDAVGAGAARDMAVELTQLGGTIILLGHNEAETRLNFRQVVRRELRLQATYGFTEADFVRAKQLIESGTVDLRRWMRTFPLTDGQAAFELCTPVPEDLLKVVLRPGK
ncbi:MAG: alcohol dehydrogenase catalytic domain-containing protein [Armatimonadetes bacterium]|nr:alcohol dehydrogenase catalytic domain-containing protein [Armatimonadota bacterium]